MGGRREMPREDHPRREMVRVDRTAGPFLRSQGLYARSRRREFLAPPWTGNGRDFDAEMGAGRRIVIPPYPYTRRSF